MSEFERGRIGSFNELYRRLDLFLTSSEEPWMKLDSRAEDFHGATYEVPLSDFSKDEENDKVIYIHGDRYLYSWVHEVQLQVDSSTGETVTDVRDYETTFPAVLIDSLPNANVITNIDRGISSSYDSKIADVTSAINSMSIKPNIVICNGLERSYIDGSEDSAKSDLATLQSLCDSNSIELYVVSTPYSEELFSIDTVNNINKYNRSLKNNIISVMNHVIDVNGWGKEWLSNTLEGYFYGCYIDELSHYLNDYILGEVFGITRKKYYLSLNLDRITNESYLNFIGGDYLAEDFSYSTFTQGNYSMKSPSGTNLSIFRDTGYKLSFALHLGYDPKLWTPEQANVNCEYEGRRQKSDCGLIPMLVYSNGQPYRRITPPNYPTVGTPWLTISDDNISDYGIVDNNTLYYYFTKNKTSATVTIRIVHAEGKKCDRWQSVCFGLMADNTQRNSTTLYCAGGNQALTPAVWSYYTNTWISGARLTLDMINPALSNSNASFPVKFGDSNLSNFRVLSETGIWHNVFSAKQGYESFYQFTWSTNPPLGVVISPHEYIGSEYTTSFSGTNTHHRDEVYSKKKNDKKYIHELFSPLEVYLKSTDAGGEDDWQR